MTGTVETEAAEFERRGFKHEVLNAKNHEREAYSVVQGGRKGVPVGGEHHKTEADLSFLIR